MKKLKITFLLIFSLYISSCEQYFINTESQPHNLRIESLRNPLGIDVRKPRFSWQLLQSAKGQRAYQIQISTSASKLEKGNADIWDSKKVRSGAIHNILYQGPALKSGERYFWHVKVWDRSGDQSAWSKPAYWSMGVLNSEDWKGQWITYDTTKASFNHYSERFLALIKKLKELLLIFQALDIIS